LRERTACREQPSSEDHDCHPARWSPCFPSGHRPLSQNFGSVAHVRSSTLTFASADESVKPLLASKVNVSRPRNPLFGVYLTCAVGRSYGTAEINAFAL